jgi:hypothetical protein
MPKLTVFTKKFILCAVKLFVKKTHVLKSSRHHVNSATHPFEFRAALKPLFGIQQRTDFRQN